MADPNSPISPQEAEGIDDFLTPEDPKLQSLLEKGQTEMQTADSPGAVIAAATGPQEERSQDENQPSDQASESSDNSEGNETQTAQQKLTPQQPQSTPLSQVPIDLQIEVKRLPMSLQRIFDLQPGTVLPLDMNLEGDVDLVIGEKKIGTAQLVRIGDALGMRITGLEK